MIFSISVIIPAYNVEPFIEKAINSAILQSSVEEVVVIDDGSTDNTLKIVKTMQSLNTKIKIFHHKYSLNQGRSASRNLGIKNAAANYIAFLDADDFYLENRFKNDNQIFEEHKEIELYQMGNSDYGLPIYVCIVNGAQDSLKTFSKARNETTILINNAIHPGEPDGVNAMLIWTKNWIKNGKNFLYCKSKGWRW